MNHHHEGWDTAYRAGADALVDASMLDAVAWRTLQASYRLGDLEMPCCRAPAVPKTSPNGFPFFAHLGGACATSPESQWHLQAKQLVRDAARSLGYHVELERCSEPGQPRWRADIWIETSGTPFVVELQRSYQHLRDYEARQQRYTDAGLRCLWLLFKPRYQTLIKAMVKHRQRHDFPGQRLWPQDQRGCIRGVPIGLLDLDAEPVVMGPDLSAPVSTVLEAFAADKFQWQDGRWLTSRS